MTMRIDGRPLGNPLSDNAYESDGDRYHDVFDLAYAAVLERSPMMRQLTNRKCKSNKQVEQVEDGGRAIAIEEGISALAFGCAHDHAYLEGVNHIDYGVLRTIKQLTSHLKVSGCLGAPMARCNRARLRLSATSSKSPEGSTRRRSRT